jgi:hypothetical protein
MPTEEVFKWMGITHWFKNIFETIKNKNRFILDKCVLDQLNNFLTENKPVLTKNITKSTKLFRARQIPYYQKTSFKNDEMTAPPAHYAKAGRMNPVGIPYLYTADAQKTAIMELRPWKGSKICVATLETVRDLKIFDPTSNYNFPEKEISIYLSCLNELFSIPNDPEDAVGYAPTQYISEVIKNNNYDGILYKSSLWSEGYNIALFDTSSAKVTAIKDFIIDSVNIQYSIAEQDFDTFISEYMCNHALPSV